MNYHHIPKAIMLILVVVLTLPCLLVAEDAPKPSGAQDNDTKDGKQANKLVAEEQQLRHWSELHGFSLGLTIKSDLSKSFVGGISNGGVVTHLLMEPTMTVDTEKAGGWKSGKFFVSLHHYSGGFVSQAVGDAQGVSNIQDSPRTYLFEAWYEHTLLGGKLRFKGGRVDANSEFAHVDNGSEFLNSSMGFSPTIFEFPTYPRPRLSANVFAVPNAHVYGSFGVYGAVGGVMPIGEVGSKWSGKIHPGRLGVGFWRFNGPVALANGAMGRDTAGAYVVLDQTLWRKNAGSEDGPGIGMFFQYGSADPVVSTFSVHTGAGFQWTGPLPNRQKDVLGVGVSRVRFGDMDPDCMGKTEFAVETLYKYRLRPWLSLVPDVQIVRNAGGYAEHHPMVGTLRMIATF